jgi:hypothetical protein
MILTQTTDIMLVGWTTNTFGCIEDYTELRRLRNTIRIFQIQSNTPGLPEDIITRIKNEVIIHENDATVPTPQSESSVITTFYRNRYNLIITITQPHKATAGVIINYLIAQVVYHFQTNVWSHISSEKQDELEEMFPEMTSADYKCYLIAYEAVRDIYHQDKNNFNELFGYPMFRYHTTTADWLRCMRRLDTLYYRMLTAMNIKLNPLMQKILTAEVAESMVLKINRKFELPADNRILGNISQLGEFYQYDESEYRAIKPIWWNDGYIDIGYSWLGRCQYGQTHLSHIIISENGDIHLEDTIRENEAIRYKYTDELFCLTYIGTPIKNLTDLDKVPNNYGEYLETRHILTHFMNNPTQLSVLERHGFPKRLRDRSISDETRRTLIFDALSQMMNATNYRRTFDSQFNAYQRQQAQIAQSNRRF